MKKIFYEDRIDLYPMIYSLNKHWKSILFSALIGGLILVAISVFIPNKYESTAILAPANSDSSTEGKMGLSSAAESLGIDIGTSSKISNADIAGALLTTRSFFKILQPYINFDVNLNQNTLPTNEGIFKTKKIFEKTYKLYLENIEFSKDDDNGLYQLSFQNTDADFAAEFLSKVIIALNLTLKDKDVKKAMKGKAFLEKSLEDIRSNDIRQIFSALLTTQIRTIMLANASEEFVFEVIDPPFAPVKKSTPNRFLFFIFGWLIGAVTSFFFCLIYRD